MADLTSGTIDKINKIQLELEKIKAAIFSSKMKKGKKRIKIEGLWNGWRVNNALLEEAKKVFLSTKTKRV